MKGSPMTASCEELSLDFETRSPVKLKTAGLYVYAEHPQTEIMCMAWAIGDRPTQLWLPGQPLPPDFINWDGGFRAWNATFERVIWQHKLAQLSPMAAVPILDRWTCTAAEAAAMALPRALGECARVLGLDEQKDLEGHRLMLKYCRPRKIHEDGSITWWKDPEDLERIYRYCERDVDAERGVAGKVMRLRPKERKLWLLDQRINDRGLLIDTELVSAGQAAVARESERANDRVAQLTKGDADSVTKTQALTAWLRERIDLENLQKQTVKDLLNSDTVLSGDVREVLELRADVGRTSLAKYTKVDDVICADNRARGLTMYHGASTGRWTGKLLQPHNFPRPELDPAPYLFRFMNRDWLQIEADDVSVMKVAVSMLRGIFVPPEGSWFYSADFAQIEARVLGFLAGEPYGKKEYEQMGAAIFGIPVAEVGKESFERQIGKNAVLGCGFGMGPERFVQQVFDQTGIRIEEELGHTAVGTYRDMKPKVVLYWKRIESAAKRAAITPGLVVRECGVRFMRRGQFLFCVLPSGRALAYAKPILKEQETPWGEIRPALTYAGIDSRKGARRWDRIQTYGGHLTENVVQAMARDVMADAMLRVEEKGYRVVLTVHDEILAEHDDGDLEEFMALMQVPPTWAPSCPIEAEGWKGDRWHK